MQKFKFPGEVETWITSFLTNRKVTMQVGNIKMCRTICNGLPQGDVLSPTLFNVYTTELHNINQNDVVLIQFADDFALLVRGKNNEEANEKTQNVITQLVNHAESLNLKINPDKTKIMLFQGGNYTPQIRINGIMVETVTSHKFLGLQIDRFLSFGGHIREMKRKINERLSMLKVISSIRHGGHPQTMKMIYNALIRNAVEYGSSILNNSSETNKKVIQTSLNSCLRKVTGCTKTTPINTLLALSGQEPWKIRGNFTASKEITKHFAFRTPVYEQLNRLNNFTGNVEQLSFIEQICVENYNIFNPISPYNYETFLKTSVEIHLDIGMAIRKAESNPVKMKQLVLCLLNGKYEEKSRSGTR